MAFLSALIGLFIPVAHADNDVLGDGPGISGMWDQICQTLPFCGLGRGAVDTFAGRVIEIVMPLITGVAVCILIYAGIRLMLSQGEDTSEPKRMVKVALIGVVLASLAQVIVYFVFHNVLPTILGS